MSTPNPADRVDTLERLLGDPEDVGNPLGYGPLLEADEADLMFAAGERALDDFGLNAEFVPSEYGGRLRGLDTFIGIMRAVYRRDPSLGLGYGFSSFIAGVNVWSAGDEDQCREAASLLLSGQRIAAAYHELAHGNDFAGTDCAAVRDASGRLLLSGRKEVVCNIQRSRALVVLARTAEGRGSRNHSQLLIDKAALPPETLVDLRRWPSVGMRGVQLGGMEFRDCPVPDSAVLGDEGQGTETALRSFQLTRIALPGMLCGVLDSGLRLAQRLAVERELYGAPVSALPTVRAQLADAFVDLLISDCATTVAARGVHLLTGQSSVHASAVKYQVSGHLMGAMDSLSAVLGANFYLREGRYGAFQKLLRDLKLAGFGHAARVACLVTMLPQMPVLARRGWTEGPEAPSEVFRPDVEVGALPFQRLSLFGRGRDSLLTALATGAERMAADGAAEGAEAAELRTLVGQLLDESEALRRECALLRPSDIGVDAPPEVLRLPARYAALLSASACLNVWLESGTRGDPALQDPAWLIAALHRLARGLGHAGVDDIGPVRERLYSQLAERYEAAESFDLSRRRLPS
ncbi:acyl-CoA dehydrogenase [Nocardiopsis sp. CNT312]|uniref:acyl-CoA dehydrogenase n=1 Tax=Nocardiopsis sp. CNT312 TaxID=1137268 RepID=UPI000491A853|nr:acyl-CoA dehydrogenase family protein [Nocardiopsis sp. CNT312]